MTLEPLLTSPPAVQVHASAAILAFVLGAAQFAAPKGRLPHRTLGWIWVVLMMTISVSSFWIPAGTIRLWRGYGPIHILSVVTPILLTSAVLAARRHDVRRHKIRMASIFAGALVVAGLFTVVPGRVMHDVLVGTTSPGPAR